MSLMGLDVGITGCKAVIFDEEGKILAQAYREYPMLTPRPGWMELEPRQVWEAVQAVIREAAANNPADEVKALSVSTHGESVVPIDAGGEELYNFIGALDIRTGKQVRWWEEKLGKWRVFEITGVPLHPMYTVVKVMWLRENEPAVFARAKRFLCVQDFVFHKLGLRPTVDYSLASRTMLFDVTRRKWSEEMLSLADLDEDLFSEARPSGEIVGEIPMAAELGLGKGAVAVVGAHDQPAGALGSGVIEEGVAMDATGTVECIAVACPQPVLDKRLLDSNLPCYCHAVRDMYFALGYTSTGGGLLRWYRDNFGAEERMEAERTGRDVYDLLLERIPDEPVGVFVLPHFAGSGTPWMDPRSKGAILGLSLANTSEEIVKGLLDGITYESKLSLDAMEGAGIVVNELRAIGGGAKSPVWLQLKADIFGKRVVAMDVSEAACLGVAILAGTAIGRFASVQEGARQMVRAQKVYEPDMDKHERYLARYRTFAKIYPALAELSHEM
jgi:xylulokinase